MAYLERAWMLGPSQCGPNILIWRPADDPRNLFNCMPKEILAVAGGGKTSGRPDAAADAETPPGDDTGADGPGGEDHVSLSAPQRVSPVPVCLIAACWHCRRSWETRQRLPDTAGLTELSAVSTWLRRQIARTLPACAAFEWRSSSRTIACM